MSKKFKMLHLDDQPEHASWIPRELNSWFWKYFREDMALTGLMEDDDSETQFCFEVRIGEETILLEYLIYTDVDQFISAAKEFDGEVILVVLDQAINNDFEAGGRAYLALEQHSKRLAEKVAFLTAYPSATCSQLHWSIDDARLIVKPPPVLSVLKRLLAGISGSVSSSTRAALARGIADEEAR